MPLSVVGSLCEGISKKCSSMAAMGFDAMDVTGDAAVEARPVRPEAPISWWEQQFAQGDISFKFRPLV